MDLNVSFLGVRNSDFTQAMTNFSAVIPLYFTKPNAAKGAAARIQIQEVVSVPSEGFNRKNSTGRKNDLSKRQTKEYCFCVVADFSVYLNFH